MFRMRIIMRRSSHDLIFNWTCSCFFFVILLLTLNELCFELLFHFLNVILFMFLIKMKTMLFSQYEGFWEQHERNTNKTNQKQSD